MNTPRPVDTSPRHHAAGQPDASALDQARVATAQAYLRANDETYAHLLRRVAVGRHDRTAEEVLGAIIDAANFASGFHCGRFADGALENRLLEIGRSGAIADLPVDARRVREDGSPRQVLHAVTRLQALGGHSRMIHRWISEDRINRHAVILTDQTADQVPSWLAQSLRAAGAEIIALGGTGPVCERAALLRRHSRAWADLVVMHHFGDDVVPSLAFARDGGPPVAVLNHADHLFWLGSSVVDLCVDLRSITNEHSLARRHIPHTVVLPIPLSRPVSVADRETARRELGAKPDDVVLLTVARAIKFRPCAGQDFLATVETVLERNPAIHLYVIGETPQGMVQLLERPLHPRIHCLGAVQQPEQHRAAADIYIETFPFGSNTALLEAALDGLPVVPACRPLTRLLVAANDALEGLVTNSPDEAAYIERILALAADQAGRREFGRRLREQLSLHHVGAAWLGQLQQVYLAAEGLAHHPRPTPQTRCEALPADIGLALFNATADGRSTAGADIHSHAAVMRHAAFVAKHVRDFGRARRLSFAALRADARSQDTWRLFLICLLGPAARAAGDWLRRFGRAG